MGEAQDEKAPCPKLCALGRAPPIRRQCKEGCKLNSAPSVEPTVLQQDLGNVFLSLFSPFNSESVKKKEFILSVIGKQKNLMPFKSVLQPQFAVLVSPILLLQFHLEELVQKPSLAAGFGSSQPLESVFPFHGQVLQANWGNSKDNGNATNASFSVNDFYKENSVFFPIFWRGSYKLCSQERTLNPGLTQENVLLLILDKVPDLQTGRQDCGCVFVPGTSFVFSTGLFPLSMGDVQTSILRCIILSRHHLGSLNVGLRILHFVLVTKLLNSSYWIAKSSY